MDLQRCNLYTYRPSWSTLSAGASSVWLYLKEIRNGISVTLILTGNWKKSGSKSGNIVARSSCLTIKYLLSPYDRPYKWRFMAQTNPMSPRSEPHMSKEFKLGRYRWEEEQWTFVVYGTVHVLTTNFIYWIFALYQLKFLILIHTSHLNSVRNCV